MIQFGRLVRTLFDRLASSSFQAYLFWSRPEGENYICLTDAGGYRCYYLQLYASYMQDYFSSNINYFRFKILLLSFVSYVGF
ncbi:hypothetical protein BRADI_1g59157v3 [Brachypodium distachyon]|uniref:Uncharacterized protein n=1 Tax=Brachypodium distachyon TaxID=15368 RepID=A0A2K2DSE9_BRADI|nr:hypothetical protein BRADI_1g59157v3 [Brachypodium distachyon]